MDGKYSSDVVNVINALLVQKYLIELKYSQDRSWFSLMCIVVSLPNIVKLRLRVWLSGIDPVARNYSFLCRVPELC